MPKKHQSRSDEVNNERMLDAISRLKRVIGAADHPTHPDHFVGGIMHVYTTDFDSATILRGLFHQFTYGDRPVFYQKPDGSPNPQPDNIAFKLENEEAFKVQTYVPPATRKKFIERLNNYIEKFISPTSRQNSLDVSR